LLTDNVAEAHSPRRADLVSYLAPGFSLAGDEPRAQLLFSYAPTLAIYARDSSLNSLTQQLNGLASVVLVPELAYLDVRAVSGVQSAYGGAGGLGTVGQPAGAGATAQTSIPTLAGNSLGLNKDNEFQTSSFSVTPYLMRRFGDWGTGRLGDTVSYSRSEQLSGFFASPLPSGGANGQSLVSNDASAHFASGEFLQFFQDSFDADLTQSRTSLYANGATLPAGQTASAGGFSSTSAIITDKVSYVLTRDLTVFASGGHEDISYTTPSAQSVTGVTYLLGPSGQLVPVYTFGNTGAPSIHDLIWSFGGTWTPNADSSLTVSYGHQNGFNSLTANGHYALTARTTLSVSYGSVLGTQLQNVQNQLNLATTNGTGTLVNGLTGGPLFGSTNALAVEDGVFRTDTFTLGSVTSLDRDIISVNLLMATQTSSGAATPTSAESKTANVTWLHQMRPDMTFSAALSYAIQDQTAGIIAGVNAGNSTSIAASLAWQWQISDTLSASVRYALLDQSSPVTAYNVYQNILIFGLSKHF